MFGGSGLLGGVLRRHLEVNGHEVIVRSGRCQGLVLDVQKIYDILLHSRPDIIVNLSALTDVDFCEANPTQADLVNVVLANNIAFAKSRATFHPHLIQMSTDHVYGGVGPHSENETLPLNVYAKTKLRGEELPLAYGATVIRTNFFGRSVLDRKASFTDWIFRALQRGETLKGFSDIEFSPLSMRSLSNVIEKISENRVIGIFNAGSSDGLTKFEFMRYFAKRLNFRPDDVLEGSSEGFSPTLRPKDMRMNSERLESLMGQRLLNTYDEIELVLSDYRISNE